MRRTGNDLSSPATAIDGCLGAGMTKVMDDLWARVADLSSTIDLGGCADRRRRQRAGVAMLQAEERGITAAAAQQIVMPPALDDLAALDHQDGVGVHDGVQAMGDDDGGAVL